MPVKKDLKPATAVASNKRRAATKTTPVKKKRRVAKRKRSTSAKTKKAAAAAAAAVTPPRPPSQPVGDNVELSPNSLAKCQGCRRRILEQEPRIGKEVYYAPRKSYHFQYYHQACYEHAEPNLVLHLVSGNSIQQELAKEHEQQAKDRAILRQRSDLKMALNTLRSAFAKRLKRADFLVFEDKVLQRLVVSMPTRKEELLEVKGFKEKRYQSFGEPILQVIRQFQTKYASLAPRATDRTPATARLKVTAGTASQDAIVIDNSDDDDADDDILVGETLSCEEIVNRKFKHAAANGYMISVEL